DHTPDVVDRDDLVDAYLARFDVDGHLGDLHAERQHLHTGRVRSAGSLAEDLTVLEEPGDLGQRPGAPVSGDDLAVPEVEDALLQMEPLGRDLDQLALRVGCRGAYGRPHRGHR